MTYSVGNSEVANYANTSSGQVLDVAASNGVGGSGESVNASLTGRTILTFTVATNIQFLTIDVTSLGGYVPGNSDITITVNPNVYVYGVLPILAYNQFGNYGTLPASIPDASLVIAGGTAGDTIKLVNNGNIVGYGGDGGGVITFFPCYCCGSSAATGSPSAGNAALSFITPGITLTIENNGYIAGGGGGGAGTTVYNDVVPGGGGGAGGGISGLVGLPQNTFGGVPTVRATPPNAGNSGTAPYVYTSGCGQLLAFNGGGGGFVLPGTGGGPPSGYGGTGGGGGAGGSGGAASDTPRAWNNSGGSANNAAPTPSTFFTANQGGGGGGWGASGASGYQSTFVYQVGAIGGNSIITNGNAYTMVGDGATRLYGAVNTARTALIYTIPASQSALTLNISTLPGFVVNMDVIVIVPYGVVLKTFSIGYVAGGSAPRSVRLINNGYILGTGGRGGAENGANSVGTNALSVGVSGSLGSWSIPLIIENNGFIAGGGGGGAIAYDGGSIATSTKIVYGGGGAGGGESGTTGSRARNTAPAPLVIGPGKNGTNVVVGAVTYSSGGTGGNILPGVRVTQNGLFAPGSYPGVGGQAGGSGAFWLQYPNSEDGVVQNILNYGGAGGEEGGTDYFYIAGGGGGGWGAYGGSSNVQSGRQPGYAIKLISLSVPVYISRQGTMFGIIAP
jgi:hypothetical protein